MSVARQRRGRAWLALRLAVCSLALGCQRGCGSSFASGGDGAASTTPSAASAAEGREPPSLVLPDHLPSKVVFSADGQLLASVGQREVLVWNVAERRVVHAFPVAAVDVHFSPDGQKLAAVTLNHVRLLARDGDRVSNPVPGMGEPSGELTDQTRVSGVGWLGPDELVAGFRNGERVSVVAGKLGPRARLSARNLSFVSWDPGPRRVALVPDDPAAPMELASGAAFDERAQLAWPGRDPTVLAVRFSPAGNKLAGLDNRVDNAVRIWDAASGRETLALTEPRGRINDLAWSSDGARLVLAAHDKGLHVVSAESGKVSKVRALAGGSPNSVAWAPDARTLALAWSGITLHDAETLEPTARLVDSAAPAGVVCAANEDSVAGVTLTGDVVIWELGKGEVRVLPELGQRATRLGWVEGDASFVVAGADALLVVDRASGSVKQRVARKFPFSELGALSPDGKWAAEVQWLEARAGRADAGLDAGEALPPDLPPEPEAQHIRGGINFEALRVGRPHLILRSLAEGAAIRDFGVVAAQGEVGFSEDGGRVAVVSKRGIEVFEVASGRVVRRITMPPRALDLNEGVTEPFGALSPDGRHVAVSAERFGELEVWDVAEGRPGSPFPAPSDGLITFARDGHSIVTARGTWHAIPGGGRIGVVKRVRPQARHCVGRGGRWVAGPTEHGIVLLRRDGKSLMLSRVPYKGGWRVFAREPDGSFDAADDVLVAIPMRHGGKIAMASAFAGYRKPGLLAAFVAGLEKVP